MLLKLLTLPVSAPLSGVRFCLNRLVDMAEEEMLDDAPVREALLLLTLQVEEGVVDEAEYAAREAELLQQLRAIRAYKEQRAREQAGLAPVEEQGGPVVFSASGGGLVVEVHDHYGLPEEGAGQDRPR